MAERTHVSYSKCYKPKDGSNLIPEYWAYALKNQDKRERTNYRQFYKTHR